MDYSKLKIPNHLAIIVDGNGRWATEKGLIRSDGHKAGLENLERICNYAADKGVKYISLYVFSTENFKRAEEEVSFLMNLAIAKFSEKLGFFDKENFKVVFSGLREGLSEKLLKAMDETTVLTKNNTRATINLCFNYGGHAEIIEATKKIIEDVNNNKLDITNLNEEIYAKYLFQDLPPVDYMIRTSGEERISNFMLWQIAYAEMYFPRVYFPDFTTEEFDKAIINYTSRDRRFGGINYENKNN